MHRIAVFASGSGSNAEAIARHFRNNAQVEVALLVSNRAAAAVHERMLPFGIATHTFPKEEWGPHEGAGERVLGLLREAKIDMVVLAGFLAYVPSAIVRAYEGRIVNIHPSLLPKYGGAGMYGMNVHRAVLAAGETESGITIHRVTTEVDGGEILFQAKCEVAEDDTPETLAERIHKLEHEHYPRVIERLLS